MTPQQQADEMAREIVKLYNPEHPANQLTLFNAIHKAIPLVQLLECVEALRLTNKNLRNPMSHGQLQIEFILPALTNLDRAMKGEK